MNPRCPLCEQSRHRTRFSIRQFQILECEQCGLVRLHPFPTQEELQDLYSGTYFHSESASERGYLDYESESENYLRTFTRRLNAVRKYVPQNSRVLEIGCALGFFVEVLLQNGYRQPIGLDLSGYAVERARSRLGSTVELHACTIRELPRAEPFDVIFMWDVIEHVPDPVAELQYIRTLLNPGGRLILETQDVGSLLARWSGPRWHMYKVPEHLYHFNSTTVRRLLEKAGYRVLKITRRAAGKYISGRFIVERIGRYWKPLALLFAPFEKPLRSLYVNPHDEMIVVAEKLK